MKKKRHQEQLEQYKRRQQEQVARQNEQRRQAALHKKQKEEADRRLQMLEQEAQLKDEQEHLLQKKEEALRAQQDWQQGQQKARFSTYDETPPKKDQERTSAPRHKGFDNDKFRKYNNGASNNQSPGSQSSPIRSQNAPSPANVLVLSPERETNQSFSEQLSPDRSQGIQNHFPDSPVHSQMGGQVGFQQFTPQKSESPMPQVQFDDLEENLMNEILSDLETV